MTGIVFVQFQLICYTLFPHILPSNPVWRRSVTI